jgi:hypothetical protein
MAICNSPVRKALTPGITSDKSDFTFFQLSEVGDIFYQEYVYEVNRATKLT